MSNNSSRILLSPLDWGLGHAARCIPLIRKFRAEGNAVTVFATPALNIYLHERFPDIEFIEDYSTPFSYGLKGIGLCSLIRMALEMKRRSRIEQSLCADLCARNRFDLVISDNRYGFRCKGIRSVLITHQLAPIVPIVLRIGLPVLRKFLKCTFSKFSEIWIPDTVDYPGLAGKLSHLNPQPDNVKFIGMLSRFSFSNVNRWTRKPGSVLIITSGPADHRKKIAEALAERIAEKTIRVTIAGVQGDFNKNNIQCIGFPSDEEMLQLICESEIIISRFGYSTMMDLLAIGRSAVLIPTPGQTEQKYLAQIHSDKMVVVNDLNKLLRLFDDQKYLKGKLLKNELIINKLFASK